MQLSVEEKAELAEVYERAAEYLEKYGWKQYDLGSDTKPRCFNGATWSASCELFDVHWRGYKWETASKFAAQVLELSDYTKIPYWNDDPDRTVDEVINTFHALANKLR